MKRKDILKKIRKQEEYLKIKIGGHGGGYCIDNNTGRITTDYVGLKNKLQLIPIKIHLWLIWKLG